MRSQNLNFPLATHCKSISAKFWSFLTPHCASNWAQGPHMDLNLEVYYLSVEAARKRTFIIDAVYFLDILSFMVIFSHF